MDSYNLILGFLILTVGLISSYLIVLFNRKDKMNPENQRKIDHNDFWLYIAAIGGLIGGLVLIIKELMKL